MEPQETKQVEWVDLGDIKPQPNKTVMFAHINYQGIVLWESQGFAFEDGGFGMEYCDGMTVQKLLPTHWREIS